MMQIPTVRSHEIWLSGTPLFCRSVAGSVLTPALALDYLGELATDIEDVVVLDRDGRVAAATGDDEGRADRMRELFVALLDRAADAAPAASGVDQLAGRRRKRPGRRRPRGRAAPRTAPASGPRGPRRRPSQPPPDRRGRARRRPRCRSRARRGSRG